MTKCYLLSFCGFLLCSCVSCNFVQPKIKDIQLTNFDRISLDSLEIGLSILVENANAYKLGVRDLRAQVSLNGQPAGRGFIDSTVWVAKKTSSVVPVRVRLSSQVLMKQGVQLIFMDSIPYLISGSAQGKLGWATRKINFQYHNKFSRNEIKQFIF